MISLSLYIYIHHIYVRAYIYHIYIYIYTYIHIERDLYNITWSEHVCAETSIRDISATNSSPFSSSPLIRQRTRGRSQSSRTNEALGMGSKTPRLRSVTRRDARQPPRPPCDRHAPTLELLVRVINTVLCLKQSICYPHPPSGPSFSVRGRAASPLGAVRGAPCVPHEGARAGKTTL